MKIRLLHVITGLDIGGAEKLLYDTVNNLDKNKFLTAVSYLKGDGILQEDFERIGVTVYPLNNYSNLFSKALKLYRIIRQNKIEIIHLHLIEAILLGSVIGKLAGAKVISSEHNTSNFKNKNFYLKILYRLISPCISKVIAISEAVK